MKHLRWGVNSSADVRLNYPHLSGRWQLRLATHSSAAGCPSGDAKMKALTLLLMTTITRRRTEPAVENKDLFGCSNVKTCCRSSGRSRTPSAPRESSGHFVTQRQDGWKKSVSRRDGGRRADERNTEISVVCRLFPSLRRRLCHLSKGRSVFSGGGAATQTLEFYTHV